MTQDPQIPRIPRDKRLPRGARALPPETVAAIQRERLQRGLAEVIARRGYAAASITDVVRAARVEKAVFRDQFGSKAVLLDAAADAALKGLRGAVEEACAAQPEPAEALRAGIEATLAFLASDPARARLLSADTLTASARAPERWRELTELLGALLRAAVGEGGSLPPQPVRDGLLGGMLLFASTRAVAGEAERLPKHAAELSELLLAPYRDGKRPVGAGGPDGR